MLRTIVRAGSVVVVAALFIGTVPVLGHHSFAVEYDAAAPVELRGTITTIEWTNPHARFSIEVRLTPGEVERWNFDLPSPNVLARNGWRREKLAMGAMVTVSGYRAKTGERRAIVEAIARPDGTPLFAGIY